MSKKWLVYAGVGAAVGLVSLTIGALVASSRRKQTQTPSPTTQLSVPEAEKPADALLPYADEAGFSFQYPSSLVIADETPQDTSYYSLVSLKNSSGSKMTVTVRDGTAGNAIKSMGQPTSVKFGTLDGEQYRGNGKLVTVASDQGVSYIVESLLDGGFWEKAHQQLVASFTFSNPASVSKTTSGSSSGASSAGDTVYDAEEVVE